MGVRLALIGCGTIARRVHLPALKKVAGTDVVAFASRSRSSAEAAVSEWGRGRIYDDWRKVVALPEVDAVDVCSPNAWHAEQVIAAAEAGKHILVEKPMACTIEEADAMIAAADKAGVVLHVAHNVRYLPLVAAAKASVARVGEIVGMRVAFGHAGPKDWAPDATWFFDPDSSGGGALIDLGIHIIDALGYITGQRALEVSAMLIGTESVEDAAQVLIRFEGGAVGSVHASWVARPAPDFLFRIFGREGTLSIDARSALTLRLADGKREEVQLPTIATDPYADFVRAIDGGPGGGVVEPATGQAGRAALAIVCSAYKSAHERRTVEVPQ